MDYDEKKTKLILAKAIELQQADSKKPAAKNVNKQELLSIAGELGIDQRYLEQALVETEHPVRRGSELFLGAPTKILFSRRINSKPDETKLKTLALTLGSLTGMSGSGGAIGDIMEWNSDAAYVQTSGSRISISVKPEKDGSLVEVGIAIGSIAAGLYGGLLGGIGGGVGLSLGLSLPLSGVISGLLGFIIATGSIAASYLVSRLLYVYIAERQRKKGDEIMEKVLNILEQHG